MTPFGCAFKFAGSRAASSFSPPTVVQMGQQNKGVHLFSATYGASVETWKVFRDFAGVQMVTIGNNLATEHVHFLAAFALADALWPANGMARCSSTK